MDYTYGPKHHLAAFNIHTTVGTAAVVHEIVHVTRWTEKVSIANFQAVSEIADLFLEETIAPKCQHIFTDCQISSGKDTNAVRHTNTEDASVMVRDRGGHGY